MPIVLRLMTSSKGKVCNRRSQRGTRVSRGGSSKAERDTHTLSQQESLRNSQVKHSSQANFKDGSKRSPASRHACLRKAQRTPVAAAATSGRPGPRGSRGQVKLPRSAPFLRVRGNLSSCAAPALSRALAPCLRPPSPDSKPRSTPVPQRHPRPPQRPPARAPSCAGTAGCGSQPERHRGT